MSMEDILLTDQTPNDPPYVTRSNAIQIPACVSPTPRLFAVIIGIDEYPGIKNSRLQGSVKDARSMAAYLQDHLRVPDDHILQLYDEVATRAAIIKAFSDLKSDHRIQKGDAIFIFYAGHGCEVEAPTGWETDGRKIQGLLPYDVGTVDAEGVTVEVLPDLTVASLLDNLAEAKGDNITVMFDCCHSTSATRSYVAQRDLDCRSRGIDAKDLPLLSPDVDEHIRQSSASGRATIVPTGFAHRGLGSHVLLAACGSTESAWEREGQGAFTTAVLSILKTMDVNKLTYTELMNMLPPIAHQNPQCEGENKNRILFDRKLAGGSSAMIKVEIVDGSLRLHAGRAQGVTEGTRFDIHQRHLSDDPSNPCLATLTVTDVGTLYSTLEVDSSLRDLQSPAYARQASFSRTDRIKVYIPPTLREKLKNVAPEWQKRLTRDSELECDLTASAQGADLVLDLGSDGRIACETRNALANRHGISRLPHTIPMDPDRIVSVICSAAVWNSHVGRTNPEAPLPEGSLRIEVFGVKEDYSHWNKDGTRPRMSYGENLNKSGVAHVVADSSHLYGFKIINDTNLDLYPYLFYFDASNLSIEHYYLCATPGAGGIDVPLRAKGSLSIGYGSSGLLPKAYRLEAGQDHDVGIVKLFVATAPVEFALLVQNSPFEARGRVKRPKLASKAHQLIPSLWDTMYIILAQHRLTAKSLSERGVSQAVSFPILDSISEQSQPPSLAASFVLAKTNETRCRYLAFSVVIVTCFASFMLLYLILE